MDAASASSLIEPSVMRVPSYKQHVERLNIVDGFSPPISACTPQELLPIIAADGATAVRRGIRREG